MAKKRKKKAALPDLMKYNLDDIDALKKGLGLQLSVCGQYLADKKGANIYAKRAWQGGYAWRLMK
jgi:hypothetical protein